MWTTNFITSALTLLALISLVTASDGGSQTSEIQRNGETSRVTRSIANFARLILGGNDVPPDHPLVRYPDPHTAQSQAGTPGGSQNIGNGVLAAVPAHSSFRGQSRPYQQQHGSHNNNGPQFGPNNNGGQNYQQPHFRPGPPYFNNAGPSSGNSFGGNPWQNQPNNNNQYQQQQRPYQNNNNYASPPLQATNYQPQQQNSFFNGGNGNQNRYNQPPTSFMNNYAPPPTIPYYNNNNPSPNNYNNNNNNLYQPQPPSNYPQNNYNNNNYNQNNYNPSANQNQIKSPGGIAHGQKNTDVGFVGKVTSYLKEFLLPSPKSRAAAAAAGAGSRH